MNLLNYFIDKPVSSVIVNSFIIILGIIALQQLPSREYPTVTIPSFTVEVIYPNASASIVETQITIPIEEALAGIPGIENITSDSRQNRSTINVEFIGGTNTNSALGKIRDKLSIVRASLPNDIKEPIIQTFDRDFFMAIGILGNNFSPAKLNHLTDKFIANKIRSIPGISKVSVNGDNYKVIVELDRQKMHQLNIRTSQLIEALQKNNIALPAGKINQTFPINFDDKLYSKNDVENIILSAKKSLIIKLKDIANIQLQEDDPDKTIKVNGQTAAILYLSSSQSNNIIDVSKNVNDFFIKLKTLLPNEVKVKTLYDSSKFVKNSLNKVYFTLLEAIIFVAIICLIFLKSKKLVLIPLATIPISLVGTFFMLYVFNCSINTITALALVLAIGLVVDDAIVVMENIARHHTTNNSNHIATKLGTNEISFAIIAMTLTLVSVYLPLAFYSGVIGQLFREFAIALSSAVLISGFVSLTLSPLMCARLLNKSHQPQNAIYNRLNKIIEFFLARSQISFVIVIVFIVLTVIIFFAIPKTLTPVEDRSIIGAWVETIPNSPNHNYNNYINSVEDIVKNIPEVETYWIEQSEQGFQTVMALKNLGQRQRTAAEIKIDLQEKLAKIPTINIHAWSWDSNLPNMQNTRTPTSIQISINTTETYEKLYKVISDILVIANNSNEFNNSHTQMDLNQISYDVKLNKNNIATLELEPQEIATNLKIMLDEYSPTTITIDDIKYPINIKLKQQLRELSEIYITNKSGNRTSLDNLLTLERSLGPNTLSRRDQMRYGTIYLPYSDPKDFSKKLRIAKDILDKNLPNNYSYSFIQTTKAYLSSSNIMLNISILSLIFIYSILAIQFDSFVDPLIILLTVPLAISGALIALYCYDITLNIYSQIGLITLVGLITKHGVLLIDFINKEINNGASINTAASAAIKKRLRPIIMTTATMAASAAILMFSRGSGFESRQAIGIILFYGLTFGTIFTILLLPSCAIVIKSLNLKFLSSRQKYQN